MFQQLDDDTILIIADATNITLIVDYYNKVEMVVLADDSLGLSIGLDQVGLGESRVIELIRSENVFANYKAQEIDEDGVTTYVGQLKHSGEWLLQKLVASGDDLTITYANESNNLTMTSFNLAWTNRASLSYTLINNLSGL